ncbi:ATP-binding protein [Fimbriiglobus ruber]|uniref:DNA polymerase III delta prime subunit n=1 Tax=Fimbriiglobus ruber TaxID=1908690 RepID=A0A225D8G2_9BACT|nr:DNA polymerase III subunit delta' [Fimbriiglobus ruber]OWK37841.1 DNA polymerase III delta prime subunit [Fimbriiglobus ruber]
MGWDRIRGHAAAREQLFTAHRRGRLAHAYLFAGPPGVGKNLFAVEFAKALLCEHPPAPLTACDHCPACAQVVAGTHPDFFTARKPEDKHELPIDVVREFCSHLGLKPARGPHKIGVVEDADDFNEESANCFLKTLEEPPAGALLILLATGTERQLPTILSRAQVVRFHPLKPDDLRAVLADHEVTDPPRVDQLVRLAGGSPGQALALNDDALWAFRETLVGAVTAQRPDPVGFAAEWMRFVEEAGKESAAQRQRASLVIRLLTDLLHAAVRTALGADADGTPDAVRGFALRTGADHLADLMEACSEADYLIERKVQLVLVIESLVDKLFRPAPAGV